MEQVRTIYPRHIRVYRERSLNASTASERFLRDSRVAHPRINGFNSQGKLGASSYDSTFVYNSNTDDLVYRPRYALLRHAIRCISATTSTYFEGRLAWTRRHICWKFWSVGGDAQEDHRA